MFKTKDFINFEKMKLFSEAQAPMAILNKENILFSYRYLPFEDMYFLALSNLKNYDKKRFLVDIYFKNSYGNFFDGAYSDLKVFNDKLLIIYYLSDKQGNTFLKGSTLKL
ncbi:MAG TPA: hypothetical protein EYP03_03270 [Aquificae bacterium]|nr:hypothetical protein [Aquificota bacterium]